MQEPDTLKIYRGQGGVRIIDKLINDIQVPMHPIQGTGAQK